MDAVINYQTWTSIVEDNRGNSWSDVLWALLARDNIFDAWERLSATEKNIVEITDAKLKNECRKFIADNLPAKNSTPQAKAEGRWWWFLNEA